MPQESILVTNVSGTSWTVTRGADNTTPVAHSSDFTIYQVASSGVMALWVQNPMSGVGDMIVGGTSGAPQRLASSTATYVLTSNGVGTLPTWQANPAGFTNPMTTEGDIIVGASGGAATRLAIGTSGDVLTSNGSGQLPSWQAGGGGGGAGGSPTAWFNVVTQYSADNTGATNCYTAVNNAITAAAEETAAIVYFPAGVYSTNEGWTVPPNVSLLGDFISGTASLGLTGTVIKPSSSFSGTQGVFYIPDVGHAITTGPQIQHMGINGSNHTSSSVDGIQCYGPVLTTVINDVRCVYMSGWGLNFVEDPTAAETTEGFPFGLEITNVYVDTCGQSGTTGGINAYWCEDSTFINVYVIGNEGPGWVVTGCDNTKFVACRSEWNSTYGWHITGDWTYASTGTCQFVGCSTDRNTYDGVYIDAEWSDGGDGTGPSPLLFTNLTVHRDGETGGAPYAGVRINGSGNGAGYNTLPTFFWGLTTGVGDDDGGGGNMTPYYGVYVSSIGTAPVMVYGGQLWGFSTAIGSAGTTTNLEKHAYFPVTGNQYAPVFGAFVT